VFSGVFCGPESFGNSLVDSADDYFIQLSDYDAIYADKRLPEVCCLSIICAGSFADVTTELEASSESETEPDHGNSTISGLPDKSTTMQQEQTTIPICIQPTNLLQTDLVVVYAVAEVAAHEVTLDKVDVVEEHVVTVEVVAVFLTILQFLYINQLFTVQ